MATSTTTALRNILADMDQSNGTDIFDLEFDRLTLGRAARDEFQRLLRSAVTVNEVDYSLRENRRVWKSVYTDVKITGEADALTPIVRALLTRSAR